MKIATWNINGVKARLEGALTWLKEAQPDVACFQEIKSSDEAFPAQFFEELGYHLAVHGQKGFNGVAVLSKRRLDEVVVRGLPGDATDAHARYLEVLVPTGTATVRIGNLYLPNGNPIGTDRFAYKLAWMRRLEARARELLALEEAFLLLGDYNVIPTEADVHDPRLWTGDALFLPTTRQRFRALTHLGLVDAGLLQSLQEQELAGARLDDGDLLALEVLDGRDTRTLRGDDARVGQLVGLLRIPEEVGVRCCRADPRVQAGDRDPVAPIVGLVLGPPGLDLSRHRRRVGLV